MINAPFNLQRFVNAQKPIYDSVVQELKSGKKRSHWMWFVFPQISGLGASVTAEKFALSNRSEAIAYLKHPLLGQRLKECTQIVVDLNDVTADFIFGYPDVLKFRSCMTLFDAVNQETDVFQLALQKYFDGRPDRLTLDILKQKGESSD